MSAVEYQIVADSDISNFEEACCEKLKEGFDLHGPLVVGPAISVHVAVTLYQAFVRYEQFGGNEEPAKPNFVETMPS